MSYRGGGDATLYHFSGSQTYGKHCAASTVVGAKHRRARASGAQTTDL